MEPSNNTGPIPPAPAATAAAPSELPKTTGRTKRVRLSNGAIVTIREVNGKDLLEASKLAEGDPQAARVWLLQRVATIGGKPCQFEDWLDAPADDLAVTLSAVEGNGPTSPPEILSD